MDGTSWPSIPGGITSLIARVGAGTRDRSCGVASLPVSHAVWWGLEWALDLSSAKPVREGHARVSIGTETAKVAIPAISILRALRASAAARLTLMGWHEDLDWQDASDEAEAHESVLYDVFIRGTGDGD
ncbi:MAG: hypothetical protein ACXVUE_12495 [Solirubrobacteraceae bacterium]